MKLPARYKNVQYLMYADDVILKGLVTKQVKRVKIKNWVQHMAVHTNAKDVVQMGGQKNILELFFIRV